MHIVRIFCLLVTFCIAAHASLAALTSVACRPSEINFGSPLEITLPDKATPAPADSGLLHPKAVITTLTQGKIKIAVALDSDNPKARRLDRLRLNFDGVMKFDAAHSVRVLYNTPSNATIAAAVIPVEHDGLKLTVRVSGYLYRQNDEQTINLFLGSALQGTCTIGGKAYPVRIVDGNSNLVMGDPYLPPGKDRENLFRRAGDCLLIDTGDGTFSEKEHVRQSFYGQPVFLNNAWYQIALAPDKSQITAHPFQGELGQVKMAHAPWAGMLIGSKYLLNIAGMPAEASLPIDGYEVWQFEETLPAAQDKRAVKVTYGIPDPNSSATILQISKGVVCTPTLGAPLGIKTSAKVAGDTVTFSVQLLDQGNKPVSISATYLSPPAAGASANEVLEEMDNAGIVAGHIPFEVVNAKGETVHTGAFEYG